MAVDHHDFPNFLAGILVAIRLGVPVYAGAPGVLTDGDVWIDSTGPSLNFRNAGATVTLTVGITQEALEDFVGAMFAGNTETGITATYVDNGAGAGKIDLVVDHEWVEDQIGATLTDTATLDLVYDDALGQIKGNVLDSPLLGGDSKATIIAAAVAAVVNAAPATLDTLNELAAALGNDANFAATVAAALAIRGRAVDMAVPNGAATGNVDHNLALTQKGGFVARVYVAATGREEVYFLDPTTVNRIVVTDETGGVIAAGRRIQIVAL